MARSATTSFDYSLNGREDWNDYRFSEPNPENPGGARKLRWRSIFSLVPISALVLQVVFIMGSHVIIAHRIWISTQTSFTAFDLMRVANDFCMIILNCLVIALWSTLCFKTTNMRHLWSWKSWLFGGSTMQGLGFVPKPAALSVGFLLFVSGVFISERVVKGHDLLSGHIAAGEWCRADILEVMNFDAEGQWFSRFQRQLPIGCFFGPYSQQDASNFTYQPPLSPHMFNFLGNGSIPHPVNVEHPRKQSKTYTMGRVVWPILPRWTRRLILTTFHVSLDFEGDGALDLNHVCMYQCAKWKSWGFQDLMTKLGTVAAGAAVVTKVTESVTSVLGLSRVTAETTVDELKRILAKTQIPEENGFHKKFLYRNPFFCALFLVIIRWLAMMVYMIDDHGLYTVDYYVSMTLIFSVVTSAMLRSFNLFTFMWIAYTDALWKDGTAECIIFDAESYNQEKTAQEESKSIVREAADSAKPRVIDLFMWMHLGHEERNYLLINHARKVSVKTKLGVTVECNVPFRMEQISKLGDQKVYTRTLEIEHGDTGTIIMIEGGQVVVRWDDSEVTSYDDKDQEGETGMWKKVNKDTKIDLVFIRDHSEGWSELQKTYVTNHQVTRQTIITALKNSEAQNAKQSALGKFQAVSWGCFSAAYYKICCSTPQDAEGYAKLSAGELA